MHERTSNKRERTSHKRERTSQKHGRTPHQRVRTKTIGMIAIWMGAVALLISATIGVFTLYDKDVIRPREIANETWRNFRGTIEDLHAVRQSITRAKPARQAALAAAARPQELVLLGAANRYLERLEDRNLVLATDFLILGEVAVSFGSFDLALGLLEGAARKTDDSIERAEVHRLLGMVLFSFADQERIESGRQYFRDALKELSQQATLGTNFEFAKIYLNWVVAEASLGECRKSLNQLEYFMEAISKIGRTAALELVAEMKDAVNFATQEHGVRARECEVLLSEDRAFSKFKQYLLREE